MADPTVWHDLRSAFQELASQYGDTLTATWGSKPWNDTGDHWFLIRPGHTLDPNDPDRERHRFISLARRAGIQLCNGAQGDPLFAWLDHLRIKGANFKGGGYSKGDAGEFEFGTIERPCQASADCCFDLESEVMARLQQRGASATRGDRTVHELSDPECSMTNAGPGSRGANDSLAPIGEPQFSAEHRERFKELRKIGELNAGSDSEAEPSSEPAKLAGAAVEPLSEPVPAIIDFANIAAGPGAGPPGPEDAERARAVPGQKEDDAVNDLETDHHDPAQVERAKIRCDWLDQQVEHSSYDSDVDIAAAGGLTYNTVRRYRGGSKSRRDLYVRRGLAKAFDCDIKEVPE
jgi:hypothetical protein